MHECPYCRYRFEDAQSLDRHLNEGRGCPAQDDLYLAHTAGLLAH